MTAIAAKRKSVPIVVRACSRSGFPRAVFTQVAARASSVARRTSPGPQSGAASASSARWLRMSMTPARSQAAYNTLCPKSGASTA